MNYFNLQYINSHDEVISGDDFDYVELLSTSIQERTLKVDDIVADKEIRNFKPRSRKCKFIDEYDKDGFYEVRSMQKIHICL